MVVNCAVSLLRVRLGKQVHATPTVFLDAAVFVYLRLLRALAPVPTDRDRARIGRVEEGTRGCRLVYLASIAVVVARCEIERINN